MLPVPEERDDDVPLGYLRLVDTQTQTLGGEMKMANSFSRCGIVAKKWCLIVDASYLIRRVHQMSFEGIV